MGVVVGRREVDHHPELRLGFLVALHAEVRDPERLANRGLVRLAPLRLLERDAGLGGHALPEVLPALLEEVVGLALSLAAHASPVRQAAGAEREGPRTRRPGGSARRRRRRTVRSSRRASRAALGAVEAGPKRARPTARRSRSPRRRLSREEPAELLGRRCCEATSIRWSRRKSTTSCRQAAASARGSASGTGSGEAPACRPRRGRRCQRARGGRDAPTPTPRPALPLPRAPPSGVGVVSRRLARAPCRAARARSEGDCGRRGRLRRAPSPPRAASNETEEVV